LICGILDMVVVLMRRVVRCVVAKVLRVLGKQVEVDEETIKKKMTMIRSSKQCCRLTSMLSHYQRPHLQNDVRSKARLQSSLKGLGSA
jgi:hypothetical protein